MKHLVNTQTEKWYHLDEFYRIWTCACMKPPEEQVELCLTIDESLKREGELRDLDRQIAKKRKELGLKVGEPMP